MYVELHCHSAFSFLDGASLPGRARSGRAGARPSGARADRSQHRLGVDGVRSRRARSWAAADPWSRGGPVGRTPSDPARAGRARLVKSLQRPDQGACPHAREAGTAFAGVRGAVGRARPRRGPGLSEWVRASGGARRVHAQAAARRVRVRSFEDRAPAAVPTRRPGSQPAAGGSRPTARRSVCGDGQRARTFARACAAAGRVRGRTSAHHPGRVRARAARQLQPRARVARGDGGALSGAPGSGGRDDETGRETVLRPLERSGLPVSGGGGLRGDAQARRAVPDAAARPLREPARPGARRRREDVSRRS